MENKASLSLRIEGNYVENGEIDVIDMTRALFVLANIIEEANKQVNGDKAKVSVKLKATSPGSVVVELVIVQSLIDHILTLFDSLAGHKDGISAANDLAEILFKAGSLGGGLFWLKKKLGGKKPERVERNKVGSNVYVGGECFLVDNRVIDLLGNQLIQEKSKQFVSVLYHVGLEKMSILQDGEEPMTLEKKDLPSFEIYEDEPAVKENILVDEERTMYLNIDSLSFIQGNKWRVNAGGEPFFVDVDDVNFLKQVDKGGVAFSKNDVLYCLVRQKQFQQKGVLKIERRILKVIEHQKGSRQLELL